MESTLTHPDSSGQVIKLKQNCSGTQQIYRLLLQLLLAAKIISWAFRYSVLSGETQMELGRGIQTLTLTD